MKYSVVLVVLVAASASAHCAGRDETPKCNPNGSTQESNACVYNELDAADREMNSVYKSKLASLPKAARDALREEQREWLKTRDPQCKDDSKDMEGLSGWVSEFYGCVASATRERTQYLNVWKPAR